MGLRWLIALALYTLLIGPIMDVPSNTTSKAKARPQTARPAANR